MFFFDVMHAKMLQEIPFMHNYSYICPSGWSYTLELGSSWSPIII